jgi:hypothetical protein
MLIFAGIKNMEILINVLGWTGSFAVVIAYGLNSYQKIRSDSAAFYLLNIIGGMLLIVYTIYQEAYANTFLNIVWVIIAIPALVKIATGKGK